MKAVKELIEGVITSIEWITIKSCHKKLNILWEFQNGKEINLRIPTVPELKEELRSMLWHMHKENLPYLSYANWVVFWENEDDKEEVRAIFRVADYHYGRKAQEIKDFERELKNALDREDYEYAAFLRDEKRNTE